MKNWKNNIYFVLVEPKESGNIGSAARAMNNMDFHNLRLVNPPSLDTDEARMFAHGSREILQTARSFASLEEAVSDMQYVVGTTRRRGRRRGAYVPVDQGTGRLYECAAANKVAVLFDICFCFIPLQKTVNCFLPVLQNWLIRKPLPFSTKEWKRP